MKKYFKYLFIILLTCLIVPQIALAAWWNPLSWNWGVLSTFFNPPKTHNEKITTPTSTPTTQPIEISNLLPKKEQQTEKPTLTTAPTTTPKIQDQTAQYKKSLWAKVINEYALAKTYSDFTNKVIPIIDDRINALNTLISKNNSLASSMTTPEMKGYANYVANYYNNLYNLDNNYSTAVKNILITDGQFYVKQMGFLNSISIDANADSISTATFEKDNSDLDVIQNDLAEFYNKENDNISQWQSGSAKSDADYQSSLATLKSENASYFNSVQNSSAPQININYYVPPVPTIQYVSPTTCTFHSSKDMGITSGSISCY